MLQIKGIKKEYKTGGRVQLALNDVSLALRDNEFVAILGPSGSGKTTMLNIIGGLDRYTEGDLIINGISTKKYSDRDWDSYRNHAVGFIFQSYNLIPHQNVLANVELALTISGVSKKERRERAKEALIKVGLEEHMHKLPSQMSGGQMQRVAIARALVNDPEILLADEPTGALDSETSVQIMDLLKEVAKDRLVVMVTHNPELAEQYANRIVRLKDGVITDDTNPVTEEEIRDEGAEHKNMGKSSMSFFTALALSFNNLRTKLARTILVAFAGGSLFRFLKIKSGALIGAIAATAILSIFTNLAYFPITIKTGTQICAGAYVGAQLKRETLTVLPTLIVPIMIMLIGMFIFVYVFGLIMQRVSHLDLLTSLLISTPGGMQEMSLMAQDFDCDAPKVVVMHILRIMIVIFLFPPMIGFLETVLP